jgi:aminoglycoside phosphotransferase (APT) family kinase protein
VPLETEAIVIEAARAAGVAAPRVRYVLKPEDEAGIGYVMDRLPGETIARKILRDAEFAAVRPKLAFQCGEILARIHRVDIAPLRKRAGRSSTDRRSCAAIARSTISTTIPIRCSSSPSNGSSRA